MQFGFLGSHLCDDLLEQGHEVVGLDNFLEVKNKTYLNMKTLVFMSVI